MSSKPLMSLDYAIKFLLKNKGDYEIVEGFISAILRDVGGYPAVKIIALLESESNKENEDLKKVLLTLLLKTNKVINILLKSIAHILASFSIKLVLIVVG